jgi:quinol monooxygenase YgiN
MSDTVMIPWYATGFRANDFEAALNEIAAIAMRYGATSYAVYRSNDDRYRFQQLAAFESHADWERYWESPEMISFRARHSGWYQIPVLYGWWQPTAAGSIKGHAVPDTPTAGGIAAAAGNGAQTA